MRQNASDLTLSDEGIAALAASEGIVPAIYLDSVGVETFGIGVTKWAIGEEAMGQLPVSMPADIDGVVKEAVEMFRRVVVDYENMVRSSVTVTLSQHEYDALVHFVYNVGGPNFRRSKLLRNLNAGQYLAAGKNGFHGWLKPPELRGRRDYESQIFLSGDYGNKKIPIYKTNGAKRLAGRHSTISQARFLEMIGKPQPIPQPTRLVAKRPIPERSTEEPRKERTSVWQSSTIRAQLVQWLSGSGAGVFAAFNASDDTTRYIIGGLVAVAILAGAWIFKERIRKWVGGDR